MVKEKITKIISDKLRKFKTFFGLSFLYIITVSIVIIFILKNYVEISKKKIIFQETEVIKSLQHIIDNNFENIFKDIIFLKTEFEFLEKYNINPKDFEQNEINLFYNFSKSKQIYEQIAFTDTLGNEIFLVEYSDTIPIIILQNLLPLNNNNYNLDKINNLENGEIYSSNVEINKSLQSNIHNQVISFITSVYNSDNKKIGFLKLNYKFSDLINIFNNFSVENSSFLFLIDSESKVLISDESKSNWLPVINDTSSVFFNQNSPELWKQIEYEQNGNIIGDEGILVYRTTKFTGYSSEKTNLVKQTGFWKILSFTEKSIISSNLKSAIIIWIYLFIIASIIVFILLYLLSKNVQLRKAFLNQIIEKNKELNIKNEEIQKQRDELFKSHELIVNQTNTLIEHSKQMKGLNYDLQEKHRKYSESLKYAEKIQAALLPTDEFINSIFSDFFIIFKPKEIVSGDFYWANKFYVNGSEIIVFTVADCTGHGIPGAFVSILGISLLNEILYRNFVNSPNLVLEEIRRQVKYLLKQTSIYTSREDGIDMALCYWDKANYKLEFSGANRPLLKIGKSKKVEIFEPTYNPIGIYLKETKFINQEIEIEAGDKIYLFTDGFSDQFNKKKEKYKESRLRQIVTQTYDLTMHQQKTEFLLDFENWQSDHTQIDDVLLLGIKIS